MRLRITTVAPVLAAAALLPAATAAAAPNRSATLADIGAKTTWTSAVQVGAVYGDPVAGKAPHCSPIYSCDDTLIKTEQYGDLQTDIAGTGVGGQDTLKDVDLHVYASDASGAVGELLAESTSANPSEAVNLPDVEAGYYLVEVDWFLGIGSVDGAATLLPPTPPEEGTP